MSNLKFMQGNEAMTEGAIAAGARFYAGYPITPSTEVAETSSVRLPEVGGIYIQMEDEIASIAAVIGASCSGKKSYTATSGPGFSLMQENLGVAVMAEVPCVIINVQRSGPSTGLATKPGQGDVMQARWGTHGDHGIIALSPSTVQDCFDLMIIAFNLSEKYRTPVIFLADEIVGHVSEQVSIRPSSEVNIFERPTPTCNPTDYNPYDHSNGLAALASYGSEYVFKINASMHEESGQPSSHPGNADNVVRHLTDKIESNREDIVITRQYQLEDAEHVIVAYGGTARSALTAMELGRAEGLKIGVFQPVTIWPFPQKQLKQAMKNANSLFVAELNLGQIIGEVRKHNPNDIPVIGINRVDGYSIDPRDIIAAIKEARG